MSRFPNLLALPVIAVLGASVLVGCGETVISPDEMTSVLKTQYTAKTGATIEEITCEETKAEVGAKVSCDAVNADKAELHITGEVTKVDEDNKSDFNWKIASARVPGEAFEVSAVEVIGTKLGLDVDSVACPEMIEIKEGDKVKCTVTETGGQEREATLTLTDGEGGFRVTLD